MKEGQKEVRKEGQKEGRNERRKEKRKDRLKEGKEHWMASGPDRTPRRAVSGPAGRMFATPVLMRTGVKCQALFLIVVKTQ